MNLAKNDEVILTIDRYGAEGEGVSNIDGKVVFVPFAMAGEEVLVHVILDKKSYAVAKIVKILKPSAERVCAKCEQFSKCGGCDLQHISYDNQRQVKANIINTAFKKYANIDVGLTDIAPSNKEFRYRNKLSFPVREIGGKLCIGMYKKNSHQVVEVHDCLLQSERANDVVNIFRKYMLQNQISGYSEQTKQGTVKHIVLRETQDSFLLTVVVTDKKFNNFDPLISMLSQKYKSFGIIKNVNNSNNNIILGKINQKIYGLDTLKINGEVSFSVSNSSFLQVNDFIAEKIYKKIIELTHGASTVINAYSGAGLLSAILSKSAQVVYGIEIVEDAHKNAENLKAENNIQNLVNICGDCSLELPKLACSQKGDFVLVIDPPRKGISAEVVNAILESAPNEVIYLSCNPATLARDVKLLSDKYEIASISAYDMFPQTSNVETLTQLTRRKLV